MDHISVFSRPVDPLVSSGHRYKGWDYNYKELARTIKRGVSLFLLNENLLTWIRTQRGSYKRGELSPTKIKKLEGINGWVWGTSSFRRASHAEKWSKSYTELKTFLDTHHRYPSKFSEDPNEIRMFTWISSQRSQYHKGKLKHDRMKMMENLPLKFAWSASDKWSTKASQVATNLSRALKDPTLKQWIDTQRTAKRRGTLSPAKIAVLETVKGWVWDRDQKWENFFDKMKNGKRTPRTIRWIAYQKRCYREGKLEDDRKARLEGMEG